jgi:uncharacterized protein (TIGR03086 family)
MMDIQDLDERALDQTGQIVAGIQPDQLSLPTPCSEWDVRTLLAHLVAGNLNSAARAEGKPSQADESEDLLGDNPAEAYRQSVETAKRAWRQPGRLDQLYEMPMGTLPGRAVLSIRLLETVAHGWDLARGTGQEPAYDGDVVQAALDVAQANLGGERPTGFPFAPAIETTGDLPAIDRLAAFLGRQP